MPRRVRYDRLPTEARHPAAVALDTLATPALLRLLVTEEAQVTRALRRAQPALARAVSRIHASLRRGGRLFFLGAGTSGRLGVLEAAECPPTFHTPPRLVQALIAGGRAAVFRSREGAEDDRAAAARAVRRRVRAGDAVVGIAASGVTPFVDAGLRAAAGRRAATVLITCHPRAPIPADVRIVLAVGPEVLAGSTRLKAGTAAKAALNMLTLGAMVRLGKTYGPLMVDVRPTSRKLRARAVRIIQTLTGAGAPAAARYLQAAGGEVKPAVIMARHGVSAAAARRRLARTGGSLRRALEPAAP
jgi:N-acetylmuramic acid 6-phosphate etherase